MRGFDHLWLAAMAMVQQVQEMIQKNPLIVFSKSYCPYCRSVKELLKGLGAEAKVVELDKEKDGAEIQKALGEISNLKTVPNVFIGGEHVGGSDATKAANKKGTLVPMLKKAGVLKDKEEESRKFEAEAAKAVEEEAVGAFPSKDIVV